MGRAHINAGPFLRVPEDRRPGQEEAPRLGLGSQCRAGQKYARPGWGGKKRARYGFNGTRRLRCFHESSAAMSRSTLWARFAKSSESHCRSTALWQVEVARCRRDGLGRPLEELNGPDPQRREQPKLVP